MLTELKTAADRTSYALGLDVGLSLGRLPLELNVEAFIQGFRDITSGQKPQLSREEFAKIMETFQEQLREKAQAQQGGQADKNRTEGEQFLAANKVRPGVITTASGLQYEVLSAGTGATPKGSDVVTVHYTGTLVGGTVFDSSVHRGEPARFPLDGVIPGWTEALQLMKVGAKHRVYIPAELGYGDRGAGDAIGPNCALIFDVELLGVEKA